MFESTADGRGTGGDRGALASQISTGMVRLVREYSGRGPTKARTVINSSSVTVLMADTLTKGERQLVEHGEGDHVLETRHKVQLLMREDAIALIESLLGRRVIAFMSDNHVDPDMAAEVFVLEPSGAHDGA